MCVSKSFITSSFQLIDSFLRSFGTFCVRNLLYRSWFSLNISGNDLRPRPHRPQLSPAGLADLPGLTDSPRFADFPG